jgi:DNA-binding transcriptional LysR family regulator
MIPKFSYSTLSCRHERIQIMKEFPDWADLPYFLAIANEGSFRAAAMVLGSTHATVSRHLESLEKAYGSRLFNRSVDGLSLTLAGEELLPMAVRAEEAVLDARRRLTGLDREAAGRVRVSVPPSLAYNILPDIFADFAAKYPNIELQIVVTNVFQDLTRNQTDVSIRVALGVTEDVLGRKLLQYRSGIFASAEYIQRYLPDAGPQGEGLTWLGWGNRTEEKAWVKTSPFPNADIRHDAREGIMQMHMAAKGMGMTALPCYARTYCPQLVSVPGTKSYPDRSIWLLLHSDLRNAVRVRLCVEFVSSEIKKRRKLFEGDE